MSRHNLFIFLLFFIPAVIFATGSKNQKRFVGGNLQDKTTSVKEASDSEVVDLAKAAIEFSINYKDIMGNDRDFAALAVAGVIALPQAFIENASDSEKNLISEKFLSLYRIFEDNTVRIAVLNKISACALKSGEIIEELNSFVKNENPSSVDMALVKCIIQTLGTIGNSDSCGILFSAIPQKKWEAFKGDLEKSFKILLSDNERLSLDLISHGNAQEIRTIFNLVAKNEENSKNFIAEIAENVLLRSIYIVENSSSAGEDLLNLQQEAFGLLKSLNWTRASNTAVQYFEQARKEFDKGLIKEDDFCSVIVSLPVVSPIGSIQPLSSYLVSINKCMEDKSFSPAESVVLAIISALGTVGDKNAFDALLGVTYYEYSDSVIAAARDALAKLKW